VFTRQQFQPKIAVWLFQAHIPLNLAPKIRYHLPHFLQHSENVSKRKSLAFSQAILQLDGKHWGIGRSSLLGHGGLL
jgi:hypothetical protein